MPISSPRSPRTVSGLTSPHPRSAPGGVQTGDAQLVIHSEPAPPPGLLALANAITSNPSSTASRVRAGSWGSTSSPTTSGRPSAEARRCDPVHPEARARMSAGSDIHEDDLDEAQMVGGAGRRVARLGSLD